MKIVIELDDALLRNAVQAQIGQAVASMTETAIKEQIEKIMSVKFDRVDKAVVDKAVEKHLGQMIKDMLPKNDFELRKKFDAVLAQAARDMMKGIA